MTLIVAVVVIAVLAWVLLGASRKKKVASAERQLARMVGADAAERLIKWEMMRDGALKRPQAAQRALERAEYDRGR